MPEATTLSPELPRRVSAPARALVVFEHHLRQDLSGYPEGVGIRAIMTHWDSPAFNTGLLRRFINLMGLFPVGTPVRLSTHDVAVVPREHPGGPLSAAGEIAARSPRRADRFL
jgi:hypothetical protein